MEDMGMVVTGITLALGFVLGYVARSFVSRQRRLHAKKYRGLDQTPIW
jgi:hypothetical protein